MFKLLLILRYLRRRIAPYIAMVAVALCTAMVLIVVSVMGGFLDMMTQAMQKLEGDVTISGDLTGFAHYQDILAELEKRPEIAGATPMLQAYGLVTIPRLAHRSTYPVEIIGVDPASIDKVFNFSKTVHWNPADFGKWVEMIQPIADQLPSEHPDVARLRKLKPWTQAQDAAKYALGQLAKPEDAKTPPVIMGIEVNPQNRRDGRGQYDILNNEIIGGPVTLTVLPVTERGTLKDPEARRFTVINEFKSGYYEVDSKRVFVPFAVLQTMLKMDAVPEVDLDGKSTGRLLPARASAVVVRGKPGVTLEELQKATRGVLLAVMDRHPDLSGQLYIQTWKMRNERLLSAVANERLLITILFAVVSLVAFTMIAVVFYMIVLEKTRDIGVLRALGAGKTGIAGVFLGYGLAIGILGALVGVLLALGVVLNLNEIQEFLARTIGWQMWNPEVYYLDRIPSRVTAFDMVWVACASILSSILGAILPAIKAARLDPVESLRYE